MKKIAGCVHSNSAGFLNGVAVYPAADGWKCNRGHFFSRCKFQAIAVACGEQGPVLGLAAINGAYSVNNVTGRKIITAGESSFAGGCALSGKTFKLAPSPITKGLSTASS